MKTLILLVLWLLLAATSLPLALLVLLLAPLVWLLSLPLRLLALVGHAVFATLGALLMLPARLLRGS